MWKKVIKFPQHTVFVSGIHTIAVLIILLMLGLRNISIISSSRNQLTIVLLIDLSALTGLMGLVLVAENILLKQALTNNSLMGLYIGRKIRY